MRYHLSLGQRDDILCFRTLVPLRLLHGSQDAWLQVIVCTSLIPQVSRGLMSVSSLEGRNSSLCENNTSF